MSPHSTPMPRKRLLIADDDSVFLKLLSYEFEKRNDDFDIVSADDGGQALELVAERQPDLLLLDLRMPKEDGFAVLQQIREQGLTFPVVIMTHFQSQEFKDRCAQLGADDFVVKSQMRIGELAAKVAAHL